MAWCVSWVWDKSISESIKANIAPSLCVLSVRLLGFYTGVVVVEEAAASRFYDNAHHLVPACGPPQASTWKLLLANRSSRSKIKPHADISATWPQLFVASLSCFHWQKPERPIFDPVDAKKKNVFICRGVKKNTSYSLIAYPACAFWVERGENNVFKVVPHR